MSFMEKNDKVIIQSKLFEFALFELVRNQRNSFQPLWSVDSWVKFLIWMALNCGFSGEKEDIGLFTDSLGSQISIRMRRLFFERYLEEHCIHLMADPAESKVLLLPINPEESITLFQAEASLKEVGLIQKVLEERPFWEFHNGIISIPWKSSESGS